MRRRPATHTRLLTRSRGLRSAAKYNSQLVLPAHSPAPRAHTEHEQRERACIREHRECVGSQGEYVEQANIARQNLRWQRLITRHVVELALVCNASERVSDGTHSRGRR